MKGLKTWTMKAKLYSIYKRFVTWVGDIMVATKPPKTKAEQILQMSQIIKPGDIICRKYTYYLDSILIPGEYTHSGVVLSNDEIIHAVAEGIQFIHPIDFVKDTDGFIILRPIYSSADNRKKAVTKAKECLNNSIEYDFTFNDPTKLYCHELSVTCLEAAGISITPTDISFGIFPFKIKRKIYLADNLIVACNVVYKF